MGGSCDTVQLTRHSVFELEAQGRAGGAAVVAGVGGGLALTNHSTPVHDSAYSFGFGEGGYGNMLSSAVSNLQQGGVSSGVSLRALQELGAIRGFGTQFNVTRHHQRSTLAFERGQIVLITHHFLIVRGLNGKLTIWKISGNTAVKNVAVTPTAQAVAPAAAVPVLTTGTAATAVTGAMPAATVVNNTAAAAPTTTTVSVTTGTTTVTVTITNTRPPPRWPRSPRWPPRSRPRSCRRRH